MYVIGKRWWKKVTKKKKSVVSLGFLISKQMSAFFLHFHHVLSWRKNAKIKDKIKYKDNSLLWLSTCKRSEMYICLVDMRFISSFVFNKKKKKKERNDDLISVSFPRYENLISIHSSILPTLAFYRLVVYLIAPNSFIYFPNSDTIYHFSPLHFSCFLVFKCKLSTDFDVPTLSFQ